MSMRNKKTSRLKYGGLFLRSMPSEDSGGMTFQCLFQHFPIIRQFPFGKFKGFQIGVIRCLAAFVQPVGYLFFTKFFRVHLCTCQNKSSLQPLYTKAVFLYSLVHEASKTSTRTAITPSMWFFHVHSFLVWLFVSIYPNWFPMVGRVRNTIPARGITPAFSSRFSNLPTAHLGLSKLN